MKQQKEIYFKSISLREVKENVFKTVINELKLDKEDFKVNHKNFKNLINDNFDFYLGFGFKFNLLITTKKSSYHESFYLKLKPFRFMLCSDEKFPIHFEDSLITFHTKA